MRKITCKISKTTKVFRFFLTTSCVLENRKLNTADPSYIWASTPNRAWLALYWTSTVNPPHIWLWAASESRVAPRCGLPGWARWESLWRWRPRAGGPGWGGRGLCAPTASYVWSQPARMEQSQAHPRPQRGSTRAAWRTSTASPTPSHKNTEASLRLSWITATLAANDYRRPTFSLLMFGIFTTEWVSGNLPRHLLRLCVSALEDNYRLRVSGGMDAHVGEPVRLFHCSLLVPLCPKIATPPLHHQIMPLKSHENIYIFQPCSTETSTATILEAPGVVRGAVWRHFVLFCFFFLFYIPAPRCSEHNCLAVCVC